MAKNLRKAKAMFWNHACSHYFMYNDGVEKEYSELGGGDAKLEKRWRKQYIRHQLDNLDLVDLTVVRSLGSALAYEALDDLVHLKNYGDDYAKFWIAYTIRDIALCRQVPQEESKKALKKARKLLWEIMKHPGKILPVHEKEFKGEYFTMRQYLRNYTKWLIKQIREELNKPAEP